MAEKKLTKLQALLASKKKVELPLELQADIIEIAKATVNGITYFDLDTATEISAALKEEGLVPQDAELFEETVKGDAKVIGSWLSLTEEKQERRKF